MTEVDVEGDGSWRWRVAGIVMSYSESARDDELLAAVNAERDPELNSIRIVTFC